MNTAISIVTPTYNQAETISETIESVLGQRLRENLEYIIVDGGSTDGTEGIVRCYEGKIRQQGIRFHYIREKDRGQADAINKGWRHASGSVLGFLNSDDLLVGGALQHVMQYFQTNRNVMWAYGGWKLIDGNGCVYKTVSHRRFSRKRLLNYCNIGQPSCFFRRSLLDQFGMLKEKLHLAMDYDLWLRFASRYEAGIIPHTLSCMRYYPEAKSALKTRQQLKEILNIGGKYTRPKSFRRIMQYFYYYRGLAVTLAGADISRRITIKSKLGKGASGRRDNLSATKAKGKNAPPVNERHP